MKKMLILLSAAVAPLALAGCYDDGYGGGVAVGYGAPYAYDGWYDGYYGPFYDGYWGGDGFFYYRASDRDRHFHRGEPGHFRHDAMSGGNWHQFHGNFARSPGMRTPHFNGGNGGNGGSSGGNGGNGGGWHHRHG